MKIEKIIHPYITKMKHTNCHINLDLKKVTRGSGSWEISRYIFVLLLCWRSECNQIEHIKRPSQKILVYLKGMLLDEILPSQKARGTLKNETPACMDISLLKMPDLCFLFFSSWYSVGINMGITGKNKFSAWSFTLGNTLWLRHSRNKCPSTLPQRMLLLGMLHSYCWITQHENGWNSGKHNMPKPLKKP